jgi:acyl-CoA reductase-like NAD-dependent aldehyde dehydrogenase
MRHTKSPQGIDQLHLFHASPNTPPWASLPVEVRQQTLRLLARLLRQHRRRLHDGIVEQEACDE